MPCMAARAGRRLASRGATGTVRPYASIRIRSEEVLRGSHCRVRRVGPFPTPAYRPGQIQVVGDRFPESCQIPYQKCKSHCELGRPRLLTDLPVSIQYWMQKGCCTPFGNRPAATGTVDWVPSKHTNRLEELADLNLYLSRSDSGPQNSYLL